MPDLYMVLISKALPAWSGGAACLGCGNLAADLL
jgi:hypothetical protein